MSYKQAQELYKERHGKTAKTCWIADVKREHGKTKVAQLIIGKEITSIPVQNQNALT